jgi:hypothetical protein
MNQAEGAKMTAGVVVKDYSGGRNATIVPMQEEDDEALNQPGPKIFGRCWAMVGNGAVQLSAVRCRFLSTGAGWELERGLGLLLC